MVTKWKVKAMPWDKPPDRPLISEVRNAQSSQDDVSESLSEAMKRREEISDSLKEGTDANNRHKSGNSQRK